MSRYFKIDENECYMKFGLESLKSKEFLAQLEMMPSITLKRFGLREKNKYPKENAIKEFLIIRLNVGKDKMDDNNPLQDI